MPKNPRSRSSHTIPDLLNAMVEQLTRLPAEVLRLHLSSRHLVTTGNKAILARRLYQVLQPLEQSPQARQQHTVQLTTKFTLKCTIHACVFSILFEGSVRVHVSHASHISGAELESYFECHT